MSRKVIRKSEIICKKVVAHLCSRVSLAGHNYVAVRGYFAAGTGTSRPMCYLESNKSRGGEVSRKVIKRKKEIICKTNAAHLCSRVTPTGPNYIAVRG